MMIDRFELFGALLTIGAFAGWLWYTYPDGIPWVVFDRVGVWINTLT